MCVKLVLEPKVTVLAVPQFTQPAHLPVEFLGEASDSEHLMEYAGRLCYMSQKNPAGRTTQTYLENIKTQGHGSVFEHANITLLLEGISRSCTHELVRHRAGFAYCLAGDTQIYSGATNNGTYNGVNKSWTIQQLYEWSLDPKRKGRLKLIQVRTFNGEKFVKGKLAQVTKSGKKQLYKVTLEDGKTIRASEDHRFLTTETWKAVKSLSVGDSIATNGRPLYKDPRVQRTVKYVKISKIERDAIEETYDLEIRGDYHNFVANGIVTHNSQLSQRYVDESDCEFVVPPAILEDSTLLTLFGAEMCKVQGTYIQLSNRLFEKYADIEDRVQRRKVAREAARSVLPNATETKIVVTANVRAWRTFLELRCGEGAEREIRRLALRILHSLHDIAPACFNDFTPTIGADGTLSAVCSYHKV